MISTPDPKTATTLIKSHWHSTQFAATLKPGIPFGAVGKPSSGHTKSGITRRRLLQLGGASAALICVVGIVDQLGKEDKKNPLVTPLDYMGFHGRQAELFGRQILEMVGQMRDAQLENNDLLNTIAIEESIGGVRQKQGVYSLYQRMVNNFKKATMLEAQALKLNEQIKAQSRSYEIWLKKYEAEIDREVASRAQKEDLSNMEKLMLRYELLHSSSRYAQNMRWANNVEDYTFKPAIGLGSTRNILKMMNGTVLAAQFSLRPTGPFEPLSKQPGNMVLASEQLVTDVEIEWKKVTNLNTHESHSLEDKWASFQEKAQEYLTEKEAIAHLGRHPSSSDDYPMHREFDRLTSIYRASNGLTTAVYKMEVSKRRIDQAHRMVSEYINLLNQWPHTEPDAIALTQAKKDLATQLEAIRTVKSEMDAAYQAAKEIEAEAKAFMDQENGIAKPPFFDRWSRRAGWVIGHYEKTPQPSAFDSKY